MKLRDFRVQVRRLVQDDAAVLKDPDDYDSGIGSALQSYSLLRPRALSQDLYANAAGLILTADITSFDVGNVEKMLIEYPIVSPGLPQYLDRSSWYLYTSPSGQAIRFYAPPNTSQLLRVIHAVAHILPVDGAGNADPEGDLTVITSDLDALANEVAATCDEVLAAHYRQTADTASGADFVAFTTKAGQYLAGAKVHHALFDQYMQKSLGQAMGSFKVVRS